MLELLSFLWARKTGLLDKVADNIKQSFKDCPPDRPARPPAEADNNADNNMVLGLEQCEHCNKPVITLTPKK